MNRISRVTAGLIVAFGASACASDPTLDFNGPNNIVQVTPEVLFVNQGETEPVLVRLVNDRNQSIPAKFTISDVGAGITVVFDTEFRPTTVNPSGELKQPELQSEQRYFVTANSNVATTFTVNNGQYSKVVTVRSVPQEVSALSNASPAIGEEVTINAIGDVSFTTEGDDLTTVSFAVGGEAVITSMTAKSITFIPIPGSSGKAEVSHVTADYSPTIGEFTLTSPNDISVPAVTEIPLVYSSTNLGSTETVTVTATGFAFEDNAVFNFNGTDAFVVSVAPDGSSAVLLAPTGLTAASAKVSNVHLSVLSAVSLADLNSSATITTGTGYTPLVGTGALDGGTPTFAVGAPGMGTFITDMPNFTELGTVNATRPSAWYRITVTGTGDRDIYASWNNGSDIDMFLIDDGITAILESAETGSNPEHMTAELEDGMSYWIGALRWSGAFPTELLITVK